MSVQTFSHFPAYKFHLKMERRTTVRWRTPCWWGLGNPRNGCASWMPNPPLSGALAILLLKWALLLLLSRKLDCENKAIRFRFFFLNHFLHKMLCSEDTLRFPWSYFRITDVRCFRVAVISAKNHKRQRRKRQSVTAKRGMSQTPKVLTAILTLPNLT